MTRRTLDARATAVRAVGPGVVPSAASREVAVVDDDCATCHGSGSSANGDPCRPCGIGMNLKQRENVARLRLSRFGRRLDQSWAGC